MASMALKRITQETFDEVIKENVEEFEMDEKEALAEAIKQFQSQGVSLDNIDTSGGIGREEMVAAMDALTASQGPTLIDALNELSLLCEVNHAMGARNRMLLVTYKSASAFNALHGLIVPTQSADVIIPAMKLMKTVSKGNVEARDFFEPNGSQKLVSVMTSEQQSNNLTLLNAAFDLARCVAKSENNKYQLMKQGLGELVVRILTGPQAASSSDPSDKTNQNMLLQNACLTMRGLCVHDDLRRDMSCAMDNGKFFINSPHLVRALMKLSADFIACPGAAGAALSAAKTLVTTEESVQVMAQHGALDLPLAILGHASPLPPTLVRHLLGLMRNLCADDIRKDRLVSDGTLELLVATLGDQERASDVTLAEHGLACLAAMSLRSPSNSVRILSTGAAEIMVKNMRKHADRSAVQRQGCLAFRNMAARCPEYRLAMLDAGVEDVLRAAGRHQAAVDEAYGALRDLGCDVQKVRITEDGRIEAAYETFGASTSTGAPRTLKFNPIYDDSTNLTARVQEEAHAPFEVPQQRPFSDGDDGHTHSHDHEHSDRCGH